MIKNHHYYKRYLKFIEAIKQNPQEGVKECHHIIPKSLGGKNVKENLINLTPRQHYIAHWLLWKVYQNKEMTLAFWIMSNMIEKGVWHKINSKTFQTLKEQHQKIQSEKMTKNNPMYDEKSRKKLSQSRKKLNWSPSDEHKKQISDAQKSKPKTELHRKKISESLRGKIKTETHIKNLAASHKGLFIGNKNPMYGRSAAKEQNLKWYTNGLENIFVKENTQPEGWYRGRTILKKCISPKVHP